MLLSYELFQLNLNDKLLLFGQKNKKKLIKGLSNLPFVFHVHEVEPDVFHMVFSLQVSKDGTAEQEFLNCFYFFKEKCMFVEKEIWLDNEFKKMPFYQELVTTNFIQNFSLKYDVHNFVDDLLVSLKKFKYEN